MSPRPKGRRHLWGETRYLKPEEPDYVPHAYVDTCRRCYAKRLTKALPGNSTTTNFYLDGADWKRDLKPCVGILT